VSARKTPRELTWITDDTLAIVHAQQIEHYGGAHGVADTNVLRAAISKPINRWGYAESDLADVAAIYWVSLSSARGFNDGNKRTGLACTLLFLALNNVSIDATPDELFTMTLALQSGRISDYDLSSWLRSKSA
jgi:death-on-curing protein